MIIESVRREPILVIHFDGWSKHYDELLFKNSPRIAQKGTYTSRDDIPCYKVKETDNVMHAQIHNQVVVSKQK